MAAETEIISIDNVEKSLWDKIVSVANAFPAVPVVITAAGALDGATITITEIDKSPKKLADAVAAKTPVMLSLDLELDAETTATARIFLTQVIDNAYEFVGAVSVDANGVNFANITLADDDGEWEITGNVVTTAVVE